MLLARPLMLTLLAFSATVVVTTLGGTPAFNRNLLAETIEGNGRTALSPAMYDMGSYDFQRGFGFLRADAFVPGDTDAWRAFIEPEAALARGAAARDALASAVRQDPGNAHAWAHLGWARARAGDRPGAFQAWRTSTEIAPYNAILADTRLDLIGLLSEGEDAWGELTEGDLAAVARDISVLERFDKRALAFQLEASPRLAQFEGRTDSE